MHQLGQTHLPGCGPWRCGPWSTLTNRPATGHPGNGTTPNPERVGSLLGFGVHQRVGRCTPPSLNPGGTIVIILGVVLLVIGLLVTSLHILFVIGGILLAVGLVLALLGAGGRAIGGRRHYY